METEESQIKRLEGLVKQSKRERLVGLAKTIGLTVLPLIAIGGVAGVTTLVTDPLENKDLKHLLNIGIPFALGSAAGYFASATGMIEEYVNKFRDLVSDIRYSRQRLKQYRTELSKLE